MATYTAGDFINLALLDAGIIGVGQTANAEDTSNGLIRLNWMIDSWARKRWIIWHLVDYSVTSTGAVSYTVGPSGDIVISPRPDQLESAFLRQTNAGGGSPPQIDYNLEIIHAREDYNLLALKTLQSFSQWIFYDSGYDTGTIYPWPVPLATIYEVHITVKQPLTEFAGLTTTVSFPPEYYQAIHTNLAVILRDAYDLPPKPVLIARAKESLNVIRMANSQIARLRTPSALLKDGYYNIYNDNYVGR